MQKLLSDAKYMKVQSERFRKYVKSGDVNTALSDFHSAQPIKVHRKSRFNFGKGGVGDVSCKEQKSTISHDCKVRKEKSVPRLFGIALRKHTHTIYCNISRL